VHAIISTKIMLQSLMGEYMAYIKLVRHGNVSNWLCVRVWTINNSNQLHSTINMIAFRISNSNHHRKAQ